MRAGTAATVLQCLVLLGDQTGSMRGGGDALGDGGVLTFAFSGYLGK